MAFAALAKERSEGEGKGVALEPEGKPLEMESAGEVAPELEKSSEEFEGETFVLSASIDSSSNEASALTGLLDENFRSMSLEVDSENALSGLDARAPEFRAVRLRFGEADGVPDLEAALETAAGG